MPIHQQLWSLECFVVETVASIVRGVTEHCLAGIQSHCPGNENLYSPHNSDSSSDKIDTKLYNKDTTFDDIQTSSKEVFNRSM